MDPTSGTDFFELVTRGWNGLLVSAVAAVMVAVEMAVPEAFQRGRIGNRLEVFAPMGLAVLCATAVPGPWMPDDVVIGQKVVLGVLMGTAAYFTSGVLKRYGASYIADKMRVAAKKKPKKEESDAPDPSEG